MVDTGTLNSRSLARRASCLFLFWLLFAALPQALAGSPPSLISSSNAAIPMPLGYTATPHFKGMTTDAGGNAYALDVAASAILKYPANGSAPFVAVPIGSPALAGGSKDEMAVDPAGNLYIGWKLHQSITKWNVRADGTYDLTAGVPLGIPAGFTAFWYPLSLAFDATGKKLYVVISGAHAGIIVYDTTLAASGTNPSWVYGDGVTTVAPAPTSVAVDASGNVYFTDGTGLREITATTALPVSAARPPAALGSFVTPNAVVLDGNGNLYVADQGAPAIYEIPFESGTLNFAHIAVLSSLRANAQIGVDSFGSIYLDEDTALYKISFGNYVFAPVPCQAAQWQAKTPSLPLASSAMVQ